MSEWVSVATVGEWSPGEWKVVDVDDVTVAVFNIEGEFFAIEDVCSHEHLCLTGQPPQGTVITCPHHGATFDLRTGEALSAPAYEPLTVFPTRIENETVQVRDDRWD